MRLWVISYLDAWHVRKTQEICAHHQEEAAAFMYNNFSDIRIISITETYRPLMTEMP